MIIKDSNAENASPVVNWTASYACTVKACAAGDKLMEAAFYHTWTSVASHGWRYIFYYMYYPTRDLQERPRSVGAGVTMGLHCALNDYWDLDKQATFS